MRNTEKILFNDLLCIENQKAPLQERMSHLNRQTNKTLYFIRLKSVG
mgnify:CR=1 FL=1